MADLKLESSSTRIINSTDRILIFIGLLLFLYTFARAYFLSLTHDESITYLEYVRKGLITLPHYREGDANNHLLNTWLMELSCKLFGVSEFTLRLPNLVSHLLFLVYSGKLVRNFSSTILIVCGFIIINVNPFLLEFFGIARGYGMSMGLMMGSLYFAYRFIIVDNLITSAFLSTLFAAVALLAYFLLLNYLLILTLLLVFFNFKINKFKEQSLLFSLRNFLIIISPLSILFFVIPIMLHLKDAHAMNFGGKNGFWESTVINLLLDIFWNLPELDNIVRIFQILVIVILIVSSCVIIIKIFAKRFSPKSYFLLFVLDTVYFSFLANYLQYHYMGILYPLGRYELSYIPLFTLLVVCLFENFYKEYPKFCRVIFIASAIVITVNFIIAINFTHTHDWHTEADVKNMMKDLINCKDNISDEKQYLTISSVYQFVPDINFYKNLYHLKWLTVENDEMFFSPFSDYYFIDKKEFAKIPDISYKIVKEYPKTKMALISNEQKWNRKRIFYKKRDFESTDGGEHYEHITNEIAFSGRYSSKTDATSQFSDGFNYRIGDSLVNKKNALVIFNAMVYSSHLYSDANVVISFEDNSNCYSYQSLNTANCIYKEKEWTEVNFTAIVPPQIKKGDLIKCYLWNIDQYPVYIDDMEFKVVAYEK